MKSSVWRDKERWATDRGMLSRLARLLLARRGFAIAFLAQAMQYGAGLLLLPFVVSRLTPAETGIWYVFLAAQGLAAVADFGLQPTLARHISAARSGAGEIQREGLSSGGLGRSNDVLVTSLIAASRRIYLILALGIFALLATVGSAYVHFLAVRGGLAVLPVLKAWIIFSAAIAGGLYLLWIPALLLGSGRIAQNYSFLLISRGGLAIFGIAALAMGGGLISICVAYLLTQFLARLAAIRWLRGVLPAFSAPPDPGAQRNVLASIWPNASRMGLVGLGAFLITRTTIFVISFFYGLPASASFAISLQLFSGLNSVAQLPMQVRLPAIVNARVRDAGEALRRMVGSAVVAFFAIYIFGGTIVLLFGQPALAAIGSNVRLLPTATLTLLAVVTLLEGNHALHAFVITTGNRVPFVKPALWSGAGVVCGAVIVGWQGGGIAGVILAQGAVQLAYNNWRWPVMAWQELHGGRALHNER